jgi:hypothetical protein
MKDKINQEERAFKAWNVLIEVAKSPKGDITYGELVKRIDVHHREIGCP